jgi:transposase
MTTMNYIGLDVHKKTISYCVKDVSGRIQQEGKVGSTRRELNCWMKLHVDSIREFRRCQGKNYAD